MEMTNAEINREVAEKVNGWHMVYEDHLGEAWWSDNLGLKISIADWNPAERIDHAWMVVDKLKAMGYYIEIGIHPDESEVYCALVGDKYTGIIDKLKKECFSKSADTAPMAICLAALEAVKEE